MIQDGDDTRADTPTSGPSYASTLRALHRITADNQLDLEGKVTRMLELGLEVFGLDIGIVSNIDGLVYRIEHVVSREVPLTAGTIFELSGTYCSVVIADDTPHLFHQVALSDFKTHPAYAAFGLESYIGTPLFVGGERFGTLNFSSPLPSRPFSEEDVDLLRLMAQWLGYEIGRARQQAALAAAKENAETANLAKSEFLATVSHELRTAMNGVLGVAQLLGKSELNESQQIDIDTILSAGRGMMSLLDDLLDVSSIETGQFNLQEQVFAVSDIISGCIATLTTTARDKGLQLVVENRSARGLWLLGDAGRVRQILLNLLSNAIKYTDTGEVRVSMDWRQDDSGPMLTLTVADTGIGIADDEQAQLFERFIRASSGHVRMREGMGLGLAICRQLCERMGGRISLDSEFGRGSTFRVELPIARAQVPQEESPATTAPRSRQPSADDAPLGLSVLLAEDNLISQKITARMLRSLGCEVATVDNGALAVAWLQDTHAAGRPVDIVLMDGRMPVMDGYQAARAIRALPGSIARVPIVALTAGAMDEDIERGLEVGMDAVVHKPLDLIELAAVLRRAAVNPDSRR